MSTKWIFYVQASLRLITYLFTWSWNECNQKQHQWQCWRGSSNARQGLCPHQSPCGWKQEGTHKQWRGNLWVWLKFLTLFSKNPSTYFPIPPAGEWCPHWVPHHSPHPLTDPGQNKISTDVATPICWNILACKLPGILQQAECPTSSLFPTKHCCFNIFLNIWRK